MNDTFGYFSFLMQSSQKIRCLMVYLFLLDLLGGNLLCVADEDGHVKLIDTKKRKESSLVKGIVNLCFRTNLFTY